MSKEKNNVYRVRMAEGKRNVIAQLLQEYEIESASDIQDELKDLLDVTIEDRKEAKMDKHPGYEKSQSSDNYVSRNRCKRKHINSSLSSMDIEVPQNRESRS